MQNEGVGIIKAFFIVFVLSSVLVAFKQESLINPIMTIFLGAGVPTGVIFILEKLRNLE